MCLSKHRRNTFKVMVREKRGNESEGDRVSETEGETLEKQESADETRNLSS